MKRYNSNRSVIEAFAALRGESRFTESGRAGNVFFENGVLYSYGHHFPLAQITPRGNVILNTRKYSVSTSRHQSLTRRAFDGILTTDGIL
jgi:hypothetical protein